MLRHLPLILACWLCGSFAVAQEIRRAVEPAAQEALAAALEKGEPEALEAALVAGGDASLPMADGSGDTAIHRLVKAGRADLLDLCYGFCTGPVGTGADGLDPLSLAVALKDFAVVQALLRGGVDPNTPNDAPVKDHIRDKFPKGDFQDQMRFDPGLTPLMFAAAMGDEATVKALLAAKGDPDRVSRRYRMDAVIIACKAENIRCAQLLCGRDPDAPTTLRLVVCLGEQRVTVFKGEEVVMTARCSTGRKGYETPVGKYVITSKHKDWISTIYKVPMPWLMRLSGSSIGLHQGAIPGYPASHGCVRLPAGKAEAFFKVVRVGDAVEIRH